MESKFYKWSKNGNKMLINSGFKEFDRQTNCITDGNCISNTQYSNYIRTWSDTECNGHKFNEGELFNSDLKFFDIENTNIKQIIKELNVPCFLYEYRIYRNGEKIILGWIIRTAKKNGVKSCAKIVNNTYKCNYNKRFKVLSLCNDILDEKGA